MKTLSKIIRGVMVYWIIFVAVAWAAFFIVGSVPDTLVQYGLGGGAVELVAGAFIEVAKKAISRKYGGGEDDHGGIDRTDPGADIGAGDRDQSDGSGDQDNLG